jgi:hypothetical protein
VSYAPAVTGLTAALLVAIAVAACTTTPNPPIATAILVPLAMDATGLGLCTTQWYVSCNYGIRVEGAGSYDHRGNFTWDRGPFVVGGEERITAGPVAATGIEGDVPPTLGSGQWTISFRRWYGSDAIQLVPVPGGTPREREEDPFDAACSLDVDTSTVASVTLHVAFNGQSCKIETQLETGAP